MLGSVEKRGFCVGGTGNEENEGNDEEVWNQPAEYGAGRIIKGERLGGGRKIYKREKRGGSTEPTRGVWGDGVLGRDAGEVLVGRNGGARTKGKHAKKPRSMRGYEMWWGCGRDGRIVLEEERFTGAGNEERKHANQPAGYGGRR